MEEKYNNKIIIANNLILEKKKLLLKFSNFFFFKIKIKNNLLYLFFENSKNLLNFYSFIKKINENLLIKEKNYFSLDDKELLEILQKEAEPPLPTKRGKRYKSKIESSNIMSTTPLLQKNEEFFDIKNIIFDTKIMDFEFFNFFFKEYKNSNYFFRFVKLETTLNYFFFLNLYKILNLFFWLKKLFFLNLINH